MAENEMNKGLSQVSIRLVQESPLLSDESINTPEQAVKVLGEWLEGMDRELVRRQDGIRGILNGIDVDLYNPETDPDIKEHYQVNRRTGKKACKTDLLQSCAGLRGFSRRHAAALCRVGLPMGFEYSVSAIGAVLLQSSAGGSCRRHAFLRHACGGRLGSLKGHSSGRFHALCSDSQFSGFGHGVQSPD